MLARAAKGVEVTEVDLSGEKIRLAGEDGKFCSVNIKLVEAYCQNFASSIPRSCFDFIVAECGIFIWIAHPGAWMRNTYSGLKRVETTCSGFSSNVRGWENFRAKIGVGIVFSRRSYFDQSPEVCQPEDDKPQQLGSSGRSVT